MAICLMPNVIKTSVFSLEVCHPRCVKSNIAVYNMYVLTYILYTLISVFSVTIKFC